MSRARPPAEAPLIDAEALDALVEDTEAELVASLLEMFEQHLPTRLEALRAPREGLGPAAHALGSAALQLGALPLGEACRVLEARASTASAEDVARVADLAQRTAEAMRAARRELLTEASAR